MQVEVNWIGVGLAALSSMVVGFIWYAPKVFGDKWARMVGLTKPQMQKGAVRATLIMFISALITAYILAHVSFLAHDFFRHSFLQDAVTTAFWLWLGFSAMRLIAHDVFEKRPTSLTLLNIGNDFATIMVMGVVIGLAGTGVPPIVA